MEFRSAIVNECGEFVCWCNELSERDVQAVLEEHPEWKKKCIEL